MSNGRLLFSIYTRQDCCLCEEMWLGLKKWQRQYSFDVEFIDIDQDPALQRRFAARIPVLAVGDSEICQYHLDDVTLGRFLNKNGRQ